MTTLLASIRPPISVHNNRITMCVYRRIRYTPLLSPISVTYIWAASFFYFFIIVTKRTMTRLNSFENVLLFFSNLIRWKVTTGRGGLNWRREKETRPLSLRGENFVLLVNNKNVRCERASPSFYRESRPSFSNLLVIFFISQ